MSPYDLLMIALYILGFDINTGKGNAALSWTIFFITLNVICYKVLFRVFARDMKRRILYQLSADLIFGGISIILTYSIENTEIIMLVFLIGAIMVCGIYNIFQIQKLFDKKKKGIGKCLWELSIMILGVYVVYQSINQVTYEGPDYTYGVMIALGVVITEAVTEGVVQKVIISSKKSNEVLQLKEEERANEMYYKNLEERYMCSAKAISDIKVQLEDLREKSERKNNTEAVKYINLLEEQIKTLENDN